MRVIKTIKEYREYRKNIDGKVGFVPTMGYLHEGHLSLIKEARKECDKIIVSIFVNPTQFGPKEDLADYPRDFEKDSRLCEKEGTDCIFYPDNKEMYPGDELTIVNVKEITNKLCGMSRPTHFGGVTTVVNKLFNIIQPDVAYFGRKDLQQSIVIKKMVKDLNMSVEIKVCPIIREEDGLAKSSRNEYLTKEERKVAPMLNKSLVYAKELFDKGENNPEKIKSKIMDNINSKLNGKGNVDYVEIFDIDKIKPVKEVKRGDAIALAVFLGKARLIDNIIL